MQSSNEFVPCLLFTSSNGISLIHRQHHPHRSLAHWWLKTNREQRKCPAENCYLHTQDEIACLKLLTLESRHNYIIVDMIKIPFSCNLLLLNNIYQCINSRKVASDYCYSLNKYFLCPHNGKPISNGSYPVAESALSSSLSSPPLSSWEHLLHYPPL